MAGITYQRCERTGLEEANTSRQEIQVKNGNHGSAEFDQEK
jgi:hypothetical protein